LQKLSSFNTFFFHMISTNIILNYLIFSRPDG
jgi:hypothetical protein